MIVKEIFTLLRTGIKYGFWAYAVYIAFPHLAEMVTQLAGLDTSVNVDTNVNISTSVKSNILMFNKGVMFFAALSFILNIILVMLSLNWKRLHKQCVLDKGVHIQKLQSLLDNKRDGSKLTKTGGSPK